MISIHPERNKKNECGNVFFYILLAIALFAALSYAVSRDHRSSSNIFTDEQAKIAAQEIIEWGNTVGSTVQKLRLRGCKDTEISFENSIMAGYINGNSPPNKSCHLFEANGGNIQWRLAPAVWLTTAPSDWKPWFNGQTPVIDIGSSNSELIMWITELEYSICKNINQSLNNADPSPETVSAHTDDFAGTYSSLPDAIGDDVGTAYRGKLSGCIDQGGLYNYYQVLIAR